MNKFKPPPEAREGWEQDKMAVVLPLAVTEGPRLLQWVVLEDLPIKPRMPAEGSQLQMPRGSRELVSEPL